MVTTNRAQGEKRTTGGSELFFSYEGKQRQHDS
jgi:hypothetical protein